MKVSLILNSILGICLWTNNVVVVAFAPNCLEAWATTATTTTALSMEEGDRNMDRRSAIMKSWTIVATTTSVPLLGYSSPAYAKKSEKEPITAENVASAFGAVRYELESPEGGVAALTALVEAEDFTAVMDFTKDYDLDFRKLKMGRARKLLTDASLKDDAVLKCNAVTFDLIGINRNSRKGQENRDEALKYVVELKNDIATFLELEKTIVIPTINEEA